ncbi:ribonuclease H-like domain-containing protein [Tanacetum coccineum]|uniref:Ribonuclease H-like domain-containing protein n=1 Tax=Tanacetum coccineum TaxID=301880 RepID=A0ABQ5EBI4_9ASTR
MAQGFGQKEGIDNEETFSPVVKMVTVRCLLNVVVSNNWPMFQLDVNNAFLYGDLVETVYMRPPEGYFPSGNKVCRPKKSLYGLKQAPRQWNAKLTSTLIENSFFQSKYDYSLYTKSDKCVFLALLVYVDDIITTVIDADKGICLNQRNYVLDLLSEYGMLVRKPAKTPLMSKLIISNEASDIDHTLDSITDYQKLMVIMEYFVNISKMRAFWSLNEDILKITILKTNTPYPSRKIRRIRACTHQRPQRNEAQYAVDDDLQDLRYVEAEFPAIVIDDAFAPQDALPCKSQVSTPVNNEIDFRISFDESDDEDYAIIYMAPLPPREQRHPFLRYHGIEYTDVDICDFKERLERIYSREIHRVQVVDFQGMPELMRGSLFARIVMEHRDDVGLDVGSVNIPYLLARHLRRFTTGRKSESHISGGQFMGRLAQLFGLLTTEIFQGLTVISPELPIIDMAELVRLQIYEQLDDTWAWVSMGPKRQPNAAAGAPGVAQDALIVDEGGQADPAPAQAPPPPLDAAKTMPWRMARLKEDVHEICGMLSEQREVISAMAHDFSRFCTWTTTGLARMMDRAGVTYTSYSETPRKYTRRVRRRIDGANTSTAQQGL